MTTVVRIGATGVGRWGDMPRQTKAPGSHRRHLLGSAVLVAGLCWSSLGDRAGADVPRLVADYRFGEQRGATVLVDSGSQRLHGRVGTRTITEVRLPRGVVHRFPAVVPPAGAVGHVHVVDHHRSLDPASGAYAVTVGLRTTRSSQNIVQKGQSGVPGGFWKLEMERGRPRCLLRDGAGVDAFVESPERVDDGAWHTLRCVRREGEVRLEVDGRRVARTQDRTGTVANGSELAIGGKSRCDQVKVGCDLFAGDMHGVRIDDGVVK